MKKIMFNDRYGLTDAVLSGRKTVTRRIVSEKVWNKWIDYDDWCNSVGTDNIPTTREYYTCEALFADHPPYKPGEIIAVAQSYKELDNKWCCNHVGVHPAESPYSSCENKVGWNNKMFVRAEACKHQIKITDIRAERLQDITDEDCLREGIWKADNIGMAGESYWFKGCVNSTHKTPREAFAALIDKVSGKGTWERNPYVWRIEFELVK